MDLKELRVEIDKIDDALVRLFCERMAVAARIADYKKEQGLPLLLIALFVITREADSRRQPSSKSPYAQP